MDLLILLAVFVALLALAYVTYRNVYNLDSRLRKIEDILKNAQVVAESPQNHRTVGNTHADTGTEVSSTTPAPSSSAVPANTASLPKSVTQEMSPYAARYGAAGTDSFDGPVPGWGGQGAVPQKVTVAKEGADTKTIEVIPDDEGYDAGDDDDGDGEGDSTDDVEVDDILNEMEFNDETTDMNDNSPGQDIATAKVADLRRALQNANIKLPNRAKKADLIQLVQEHNIPILTGDGGGDGRDCGDGRDGGDSRDGGDGDESDGRDGGDDGDDESGDDVNVA